MFDSQRIFRTMIFCAAILISFVSNFAQNKTSKRGAVCGDAAKPECTKDDDVYKPFDLVFGGHGYNDESNYFYAVVLETVPAFNANGKCNDISEEKRLAAQALFPHNKAFAYRYECREMEGIDLLVTYDAAGLGDKHFLAVYGGTTQAEAAKILIAAKKKYPKARILKMRVSIVQEGGDV